MGSVWSALAVTAAYLYFVTHLGPRFMQNRPAFKLEGIMKAYNLLQVLCSVYMLHYVSMQRKVQLAFK